jgi:hypothetical protein
MRCTALLLSSRRHPANAPQRIQHVNQSIRRASALMVSRDLLICGGHWAWPCTAKANESHATLERRQEMRPSFLISTGSLSKLSQKRRHSISQVEAVVGHQVVVWVLPSVVLQEGAHLSPRSVAGSAFFSNLERAWRPVFPSEFEPFVLGQLRDMVFSIAGFDLNDPMGNRVSTQADIPRHDFHCTLLQQLFMLKCFCTSLLIRKMECNHTGLGAADRCR